MNDFSKVSELVADFKQKFDVIVKRDGSRHQMDAHIPMQVMAIFEDELQPALEAAIAAIEWEPSDEDLLGEPAMTLDEMHSAAYVQHLAMHS